MKTDPTLSKVLLMSKQLWAQVQNQHATEVRLGLEFSSNAANCSFCYIIQLKRRKFTLTGYYEKQRQNFGNHQDLLKN